jgi:rhodanese-related sulfurtransferase
MQDITVKELKELKDTGASFLLIDVREPHEFNTGNIGGKLIPLGTLASALEDLQEYKDQEIVVHCKMGGRSASAKAFLLQNGFTKVHNLIGGIMAWKAEIDPSVAV